ncbi:MAG: ion channel [Alphaproteobacteria bacterium]
MGSLPESRWSSIRRRRYLFVFVAILAVLVAISFVQAAPHVPVLLLVVLLGIAYGPLRLGSGPAWVKALFLSLVGLRVLGLWFRSSDWVMVADASILGVFMIGSIAILRDVLTQPMVGLDTIMGGCSVYLLVGICFGLAFSITESLGPGSFLVGGQPLDPEYMHRLPQLVYLSFVVLTSVGFGDILPMSRPARGLVSMEAIFGQLYLAILVARLVSLHSAHKSDDRGAQG